MSWGSGMMVSGLVSPLIDTQWMFSAFFSSPLTMIICLDRCSDWSFPHPLCFYGICWLRHLFTNSLASYCVKNCQHSLYVMEVETFMLREKISIVLV
jgi:hypothetical protein